ncbi:unnamed protein product [[Candida] boidinii]|nr:unnamed protein product [[Candida] boidinii]
MDTQKLQMLHQLILHSNHKSKLFNHKSKLLSHYHNNNIVNPSNISNVNHNLMLMENKSITLSVSQNKINRSTHNALTKDNIPNNSSSSNNNNNNNKTVIHHMLLMVSSQDLVLKFQLDLERL